jgi:uncharacterized protein (TIGR02118 family)
MAFKAIILLKRKDEMSSEEFANWWLEEHSKLARQLPGLQKLCFNLVVNEESEFDGAAELWFKSQTEFEAAYQTDIGKKVAEDSLSKMSKRERLFVDETLFEPKI